MKYSTKVKLRKIWTTIQFLIFVGVIIYGASKYNILSKIKKYAKKNQERRKEITLPSKSIEELESIEKEYKDLIDSEIHNLKMKNKIERIIAKKYYKKRIWNQVVKHLEKAKEYGELQAEDYHRLAVAYANLGWEETNPKKKRELFRKAKNYYQKALELRPGYAPSIYGLALLEFHIFKNKKKGIAMLESAVLDKNIKNTTIALRMRLALAQMYYLQGRYRDAKYQYEYVLSELPEGDATRTICIENIKKIDKILYGR